MTGTFFRYNKWLVKYFLLHVYLGLKVLFQSNYSQFLEKTYHTVISRTPPLDFLWCLSVHPLIYRSNYTFVMNFPPVNFPQWALLLLSGIICHVLQGSEASLTQRATLEGAFLFQLYPLLLYINKMAYASVSLSHKSLHNLKLESWYTAMIHLFSKSGIILC